MSPESKLAQSTNESPVLVFTGSEAESSSVSALQSRGVEVLLQSQLSGALEELGHRSIQSVLVEGGATLAGLLLDARLVNKVTFFIAPMIIGDREAPSAIAGAEVDKIAGAIQLTNVQVAQHGRDIEITGYPMKPKDEG